MGLVGFFQVDRSAYQLGEPIGITLVIQNLSNRNIYLLVPRGRADGVQVAVKAAPYPQIKDMRQEPEPGLVAETKLGPGEIHRQHYLLSDWLILKQPGTYRIECKIVLETNEVSLREPALQRFATPVEVATEIGFTISQPN